MEGEEIGMVLARAFDLRSKMTDCIDRCGVQKPDADGRTASSGEGNDDEDEDEEAESLISIRDALESLEQQLSALQSLQHQQRYEREAALAQIDRSRMILLSKLKEYKGEDLEVIHQASSFAGGSINHNEDLLLPPYPIQLSDSYALDDDIYPLTRLSSKYKSTILHKSKNTMDNKSGGDKPSDQPLKRNSPRGLRFVFGFVAKSVLTIVGVASVLSLAGFKATLERRGGVQFNMMELFNKQGSEEGGDDVKFQCPPGKVVVMEDGRQRCMVKERVEIPFEVDVKDPKISYGFG